MSRSSKEFEEMASVTSNEDDKKVFTRKKRQVNQLSIVPQKKQKRNTTNDEIQPNTSTNNVDDVVQCKLCHQTQIETVNIPLNAEPECIVLTNAILADIYTDNTDVIQHNLTEYSIYDENGHMCSIDSGVMERNIDLYLSGYVKPIYDHNPGVEQGIAVKELGPILEWWSSSYDGGSRVIIGISTGFADYLLIEPHSSYKKYMTSVTGKLHLSRLVMEAMLNSEYDNPTYEDVLNYVVNSVNPATGAKFTEEDVIAHAQIVVDQVTDYDSNDTYHLPLVETQFIETLTQLSGAIKPVKTTSRRRRRTDQTYEKSDNSIYKFSKVTTTELVKDVFENMFADQLCVDDDKVNEKNMNKLVKTVFERVCNTQIIKESSSINHIGENEVMWKGQKLSKKMFIMAHNNGSKEILIGQIQYLYKTSFKDMAHIILFVLGYETVLGEAADSQEIFALKKCTDIDLNNITSILDVTQKIPSNKWFNLGGSKLEDLLEPVVRGDNKSFFYQFQYDDIFGRFEYPKSEDLCTIQKDKYCSNCKADDLEIKSKIPELEEFIEKYNNISYFYKVKLNSIEYKIGNFVYLNPGIFSSTSKLNFIGKKPFKHRGTYTNTNYQPLDNVDETKYPEYYRKTLENTIRGSNENTLDPFEIAEILAIYQVDWDKDNIRLIVRRMYRAEHIPLKDYNRNTDMNMLFWSDEEFRVSTKNLYGKCYVAFIENINDPIVWSAGGPDRFYFTNKYDFLTGCIIPNQKLSIDAIMTGKEVSVNYNYRCIDENKVQYIPLYKKIVPLKCLDIFAGCGGLSKGLEDSGLIKSKWAIECDDKAATAFTLNNPNSIVFVEDVNNLLKLAMSGNTMNNKNQRIPKKGEVEFICGGPPCQGFSGLNRFNSGQYSLFKNSLIVSFLSYIDYFRPKYFVMENVKNFVSFKKSMVLRLTLRCITRMGYQCAFGILQAGNFGVPQTRRRLIIMAAAPGEKLPCYPEPIHVFNSRDSSQCVRVGDKIFKNNCKYKESAPMRTVTVYDAWSDLPKIENGSYEMQYNSNPITHMQKLLRYPDRLSTDALLIDHICKDMSPLVQARMELIPVGEGSDWRDLPNREVKLSDETITSKLKYTHHDVKNGRGKNGALRGVCPCASGEKCNPQDRQTNTIIPWCLPHTGNRHNNWAGLYGRLAWTGFCSTTITNPEPMGKQGRVLHPEQHRVVSVRECARSQGFKDSFIFYGPIINRHRQIGNAVPPPMGTAIGREIIKVINMKH